MRTGTFALQGGGILESGLGPLLTSLDKLGICLGPDETVGLLFAK